MTKRIIAAWVCSVISLLLFINSNPLDIMVYGMGPYDVLFMFVAGAGAGFGGSTWRPTEKSKVGLAGGILGCIVLLGYVILATLAFVSTIQSIP